MRIHTYNPYNRTVAKDATKLRFIWPDWQKDDVPPVGWLVGWLESHLFAI